MAQFVDINDVKFFVVNDETTTAFTTTFRGGSSAYPNETFDNTSPVDLTVLSTNYEILPPVILGEGNDATISSSGVVTSATTGFFNTCGTGDYLFVDDGGTDALIMIGKIASKASSLQVTLEDVPTNLIYSGILQNNEDRTIYHLHKNSTGLPFKASESFYMVIKNSDYTEGSGLHDAIPYIDNGQTSEDDDVFAYGGTEAGNNTLNKTYFQLVFISAQNNATAGLANEDIVYGSGSINCTITPISTFSQQLSTPLNVTQSDIPWWSVYLVNPYGTSSTILPKNTSYKLELAGNIPVRKLKISSEGSID